MFNKKNFLMFYSNLVCLYWYDLSEDMPPYCSAHDEWLIMKLCMYVGYNDANNVSNVGGDPVTQLHLQNRFIVLFTLFHGHGAP